MSTADRGELRKQWIRRAEELDRNGHFRRYSSKQHLEILRKGYLGPLPPDRAIAVAKTEESAGRAFRTSNYIDDLRNHFGLVGDDVRDTTAAILAEVPPEAYEPPAELEEPPGHPYIFTSATLRCRTYFKIQVKGKPNKPQVLFWSCHPPRF